MAARILVVEDNQPNLDLMIYLLESFGYAASAAVDGEAALEWIVRERFDLIVCDVQLPGIDGYELVKRFQATERLKGVPVVAVSALAMVGDRERIMSAGFDGYLAKPIVPATFVSKLEAFLPAKDRVSRPPLSSGLPEAPAAASLPDHKATILAVDDEPTNLSLLQSILEPFGYEVITAASGDAACEIMRELRPDLILADMHLGGEPDFDFIHRVKGDAQLQSIPFVYISSTTKKASIGQQGIELGALRFIFRPIEPQALLTELESCLKEGT